MPTQFRTIGRLTTLACIASICGIVASARAAVVTPTGVTALTPAEFGNEGNLIDGSGLTGGGGVLDQIHEASTFVSSNIWLDNGVLSATLTFTLPAASTIDGVHAWQYGQGTCCTARGVSTFDISFSTDGGGTFPTTVSGLMLDQVNGVDDTPVQSRAFAQQTGVTHVRFSNMDDFPTGGGAGFVGLGEVRFDDAIVLPALTGGTGPGGFTETGATSDLSLWLKGDEGLTVDGANRVSNWADQSGHANDVSQGDTNKQPLSTSTLNGIPVATFDGGSVTDPAINADELISASSVTAQTIFLVNETISQSTADSCCNPVVGNSNSFLSIRHASSNVWNNPGDGNDFTNPGGSEMRIDGAVGNGAPLGTPQVLTATRGTGPFNFTNLKLAQHNTSLQTRAWNGDLGEVIAFDRALNTAERSIVENYLGARFGIALAAGDRYAGDDPGNGNYDFNVFGIGQDNATNSVSSAGSAGMGIRVATSELGTLGSGDYVLAGHAGGGNSLTTADVPTGLDVSHRMDRVWYVDESGDGVNTQFLFDFSDAGLGGVPDTSGPFRLLYSPTDPFAFTDLGLTGTLNGDLVTFDVPSASLLDGYYTLATVPEPGTATLAMLGFVAVWYCAGRRRRGSA